MVEERPQSAELSQQMEEWHCTENGHFLVHISVVKGVRLEEIVQDAMMGETGSFGRSCCALQTDSRYVAIAVVTD